MTLNSLSLRILEIGLIAHASTGWPKLNERQLLLFLPEYEFTERYTAFKRVKYEYYYSQPVNK